MAALLDWVEEGEEIVITRSCKPKVGLAPAGDGAYHWAGRLSAALAVSV
jgi:antitoxin (DNA-binding transcriptional repressor) of toxin-antitoxin stability system